MRPEWSTDQTENQLRRPLFRCYWYLVWVGVEEDFKVKGWEGLFRTIPDHLRSATCPSLKNAADTHLHRFWWLLYTASGYDPYQNLWLGMTVGKQYGKEGAYPKEARFSQNWGIHAVCKVQRHPPMGHWPEHQLKNWPPSLTMDRDPTSHNCI